MLPKQPALAADCVVFNSDGALLLIRRRNAPFKGRFALPGGFLEYGETTETGARRELMEETGIKAKSLRLVGVYSDPKRDPRGHTISLAYLAIVGANAKPKAGDDAATAEFVSDWRKVKLAFDHRKIVADALAFIARA